MVGLLCGDDWGICSQREVDTWVGHQVSLELCEIHVQGSIESQGSSDGGHDLTNQSAEKEKNIRVNMKNLSAQNNIINSCKLISIAFLKFGML